MRLCQYERVRLYVRLPLCRIRRRSDIHASYITVGAHHFHQSYEAGDRYTAFHQDDVCVYSHRAYVRPFLDLFLCSGKKPGAHPSGQSFADFRVRVRAFRRNPTSR